MSFIKKQIMHAKFMWLQLLLFSILEIAVFMITPFIYQYLIDHVIENKEITYLFLTVLLYFLSYVTLVFFGFLKEVIITRMTQTIINKTRDDYYAQLKKTKPTFMSNVKVGSEITVMMNEISDIITQYVVSYNNVIINGLRISAAAIILAFLNFKLLVLLLILLPLYILLTTIFKNKIGRNAQQFNSIREGYTNIIHDGIQGYEDILIFKKQEWDLNNVKSKSRKFIKNRIHNTMLLRAASDLSYLFYWGVICIIYYFGALNIINGNFTLGLMLVYVAYLDNIYSPSRIILSSVATLKNAKSLSSNFSNKMEQMKKHEDEQRNTFIEHQEDINEITFKNISFKYNDSNNNFNISIDKIVLKSHQKIGIVGESGGGKTTLLKVLSGLYKPLTGSIIVDNKPINSYDLRDCSVICSQRPHLFSIKLSDNINFSKDITSDTDFINLVYQKLGIPDYSNMKITELSGGQYHRIAIARALISEAKLYIFDEPTANIDVEKRESFYGLLDQLSQKGKIVIVITHNVNEVDNFDKVYTMYQGQFRHRPQ